MIGNFVVLIILALFSTSVMTYIAMATPIGPWIAPTLVLLSSLVYRLLYVNSHARSSAIAYSTIGGSVGGIVATACAFSFPTLFFLQPDLFMSWIQQPLYFVAVLSALVIIAGGLGMLLADMWDDRLIMQQAMPFPIGQMIYKMIDVQDELHKAWQLLYGGAAAIVFCQLQKGILGYFKYIPENYRVCSAYQLGCISLPHIMLRMDQLPMLWAIGFITGHVIAIPLAVGALAKIIIVEPLNALCFTYISQGDFMMAFCSGMVLSSTMLSFVALPRLARNVLQYLQTVKTNAANYTVTSYHALAGCAIGVGCVVFLTYFNFSLFAQLFLIGGSIISTYQIVMIAGKIGLAPLGRFATFVMVPAMLLFGLNPVQITIVATFVELCGGVATDVLFGRKVAHMQQLALGKVRLAQFSGLVLSSIIVGIVMLVLIKQFGLGGQELCVQRSQARALLINFTAFDYYAVVIGAIFSYLLKRASINPVLVLGGLLMPLNYSLILIVGGLSTYAYKKPQDWEPFWSGVFAANSIWIILYAML